MTWTSYTDFVARYPYLVANVATLALVALVWFLVPARRRRVTLWSGVANLPGVVVAAVETDYWHPVGIFSNCLIENAVFQCLVGALVGLVTVIPWPSDVAPSRRRRMRRYLPAATVGVLLFSALVVLGVPTFEASLWATGLWGAGLLALRPRNLLPATIAMLGFVPVYWACVRIELALWPDFIRQWGATHPLAFLWLGVPAGEMIWAAVFAVAWSAFVLFVLEPAPASRRDLPPSASGKSPTKSSA
jgi:hypothetical protein